MYKRLTNRDKYGHAYTNETIHDRGMTSKDGVIYEKHYFENNASAYDGKPIDRLCELEDKIEQGKMVEVKKGEVLMPITKEELAYLMNDTLAYIWLLEERKCDKEEFGYFSRKELREKLKQFEKEHFPELDTSPCS